MKYKMQVSKIDLSEDGKFTFVSVTFTETSDEDGNQNGRVEVRLNSQDYTLHEAREAGISQARLLLRRIADHDF